MFTKYVFKYIFKMEKKNYLTNKEIKVISTEDYDVFTSHKNNQKVIGTHSGSFHADEVLACVMTKYTTPFRDSWIIRSRNLNILKEADIVCDVGAIYNPESNRFDHHMKEFTEVFEEEKKIKMSSAGLVYKHHGKNVIENLLHEWNLWESNSIYLDTIYKNLYFNFICYVDANDNGISQYPDEVKPKYSNNTSYAHRIARLNPEWNEEGQDQSERFKLAMDVAEEEFVSQLKVIVKSFIPSLDIVKQSIADRKNFHDSGKIIFLSKCCPWKEHLNNIEEELGIKNEIEFVIFGTSNEGFRVQTVPAQLGAFAFRGKGLHQKWRGLKPEDLVKESAIDDIVFVHASGFIGGAKSLESAKKMAWESLNAELTK
jgi:uncharacterized UPF0160 family protein